jgi:hypothetical protein
MVVAARRAVSLGSSLLLVVAAGSWMALMEAVLLTVKLSLDRSHLMVALLVALPV